MMREQVQSTFHFGNIDFEKLFDFVNFLETAIKNPVRSIMAKAFDFVKYFCARDDLTKNVECRLHYGFMHNLHTVPA